FQAEDGIRDLYVTGVQTCALPISMGRISCTEVLAKPGFSRNCDPVRNPASPALRCRRSGPLRSLSSVWCPTGTASIAAANNSVRSEERRVGKEERDQMSWA